MDNLETLTLSKLKDLLRKHKLQLNGTKSIIIQRLRGHGVTNNEYSDFDELPTDMTKIILSKLDDRELLRLCSVDRKVKLICSDDIFWKDRLRAKFPNFNIEKYDATTYKKLYEIISKNIYDEFELSKEIAMHDSVNMLNTIISGLPKTDIDEVEIDIDEVYEDILSIATENGKVNLVKYILENNLVLTGGHYIDILQEQAISSGNKNIIRYMIDYGVSTPGTLIETAAGSSNLIESIKSLKYLFSIVDPTSDEFNSDPNMNMRTMFNDIIYHSILSVKEKGPKFKERIKVIIDGFGTAGIGNAYTLVYFLKRSISLNDQDIFDYIVQAQKTYKQFRLT